MRKQTPSTALTPVPGAPSFENTCRTDEPEIVAPADLAMSPYSRPDTAIAIHQPTTVDRSIRTASPVEPTSSCTCGSLWTRSGTTLAPTSREPARRTAVTARTAVNATIGTRARGRGAVSGRSSSTQPSGDAHISECRPTPASAIKRTPYARPRTIAAYEAACRRVAASWLVTAPTARNMTAVATIASAKYSAAPNPMPTVEPSPTTTVIRAVSAHSTKAPTPRPPNACDVALRRVTGPASRRSQRALSSSPRSSLVLVKVPHTAPITINVMEILKTVKPPTVWSRGAGPKSALVAMFEPKAAASASL